MLHYVKKGGERWTRRQLRDAFVEVGFVSVVKDQQHVVVRHCEIGIF